MLLQAEQEEEDLSLLVVVLQRRYEAREVRQRLGEAAEC